MSKLILVHGKCNDKYYITLLVIDVINFTTITFGGYLNEVSPKLNRISAFCNKQHSDIIIIGTK